MSELPEQEETTVTTRPFALTPKEYFQILLRLAYWKCWWQIAMVMLVALFSLGLCLIDDANVRYGGFLGFAVFGLISLIGLLWPLYKCMSFAYHPGNKAVMKTVQYTLSKNRVIAIEPESGNVSTHLRQDFFAIEKCKKYYLVWLTANLMFYLAKDAFQSPEDIETFEKEILPAYPLQKRSLFYGIFYLVVIFSFTIIMCLVVSALNKS